MRWSEDQPQKMLELGKLHVFQGSKKPDREFRSGFFDPCFASIVSTPSAWRVDPLAQESLYSASVLSITLLMLTLMTISAVGYGWWFGQSSE